MQVEAMLVQKDEFGVERAIRFASKSLTETEKCYRCIEALTLVRALRKIQFYLLVRKFDHVTDCQALSYLCTPRSWSCSRIEG